MIPAAPLSVEVSWIEGSDREAAAQLARQLSLPLVSSEQSKAPLCLELQLTGLALRSTEIKSPGALRVDFERGTAAHRRRFGGGRGQLIARAVGLKNGRGRRILDGTAGLGGDAFVFASLGASVQLCERSPVVAALLQDGLHRAAQSEDDGLRAIVDRMVLFETDFLELVKHPERLELPPEVVYLDPMFPPRQKSAKVKKEMALLHGLLHPPSEAEERHLLEGALSLATHRVVVKRPKLAPHLAGIEPQLQLKGKRGRFDIYPLCALP